MSAQFGTGIVARLSECIRGFVANSQVVQTIVRTTCPTGSAVFDSCDDCRRWTKLDSPPAQARVVEEAKLTRLPTRYLVLGEQGSRVKSISNLEKADFDFAAKFHNEGKGALLVSKADVGMPGKGDVFVLPAPNNRCIVFLTDDPNQLASDLAVKNAILNPAPTANSYKGRTADDTDYDMEREAWSKQAAYKPAKQVVSRPTAGTERWETSDSVSVFERKFEENKVTCTITHRGPWGKGARGSGQSSVMGNQNAKNHFADQITPGVCEPAYFVGESEGRYEWCHLVGSSLGGLNKVGNLVVGTYDTNTRMIPLEHRVARWGRKGYPGYFAPTKENPIKIVVVADLCDHMGYVCNHLTMTVFHGEQQIVTRAWCPQEQKVFTATEYAAEEIAIAAEVEKARNGKKLK